MSTANFNSDLCGFPLYAREYEYEKRCPECGAYNCADAEECEECGENLHDVEPEYSEILTDDLCFELNDEFSRINDELRFFRVSVESGYYTGLQFVVDMPHDDPEDLDNDDCWYYCNDCRSRTIRRCASERRRLEKELAEVADNYGFEAYVCIGHFSNGEAVYRKASNPLGVRKAPAKVSA